MLTHATVRNDVTPVVFRWWTGSVIALFPGTDADGTGRYCDSYQHIGQHSGADYHNIVRNSRPAKPAEYRVLKRELESAPYHYQLRVVKRWSGARSRQDAATERAIAAADARVEDGPNRAKGERYVR